MERESLSLSETERKLKLFNSVPGESGTFFLFYFPKKQTEFWGEFPKKKEKICVVCELSSERASQKEKKI